MKKVEFILLIIAVAFIFVACSSQNNSQATNLSDDISSLRKNIGNTKAVVFESLNIEEGKNVEVSDKMSGGYVLKDEQKFADEDFLLAINFEINNDKMYGFMYIKDFKNNLKNGYDLSKELYEVLSEEYGEPTTYVELPHSISKMPSYEDIGTEDLSYYMETWKVDDDVSVTLQLDYVPDTGIRITIQYAILVPPTSQ